MHHVILKYVNLFVVSIILSNELTIFIAFWERVHISVPYRTMPEVFHIALSNSSASTAMLDQWYNGKISLLSFLNLALYFLWLIILACKANAQIKNERTTYNYSHQYTLPGAFFLRIVSASWLLC